MEVKVSSVKTDGLSPSDCISNPEENEISDEDDDDRNHKHRRRETQSQSLERDSMEPVFTRSYGNHNNQYDNRHPFRENGSRAGERYFTTKFEKRSRGFVPSSQGPLDTNQRLRPNQTFTGDIGSGGRGRGRGSGWWDYSDSRINSLDIASQMVQQGPVAPGLFTGRGLPNMPTAQNASWSTFGLVPGIPNGNIETLHSMDLQGTLRPPVNSTMSMSMPRQRCRDFEERGFCLRGDMCPMEHGVNRIVVEDVQSLSQFNLPVSLPSAQLVGTHVGTGPFLSVGAPLTTFANSKAINSKSNKGMVDDRVGNGAYSSFADGAELYDPDQPLWNSNGPETASALLELRSTQNDENDSLIGADSFGSHHIKLHASASRAHSVRSTGIAVGSTTTATSVSGRIGNSRSRRHMKEKTESPVDTSDYLEGDLNALTKSQGNSLRRKQAMNNEIDPKTMEIPAKMPGDQMNSTQKPSQKASRTLFVNGIPQKSNKREALLSHFKKFGKVIDIHIPMNSERAFIQFSQREEAEAALRAPDAVMGNRFIKLWWANRDNISDDGSRASLAPHGATAYAVPPHSSNANKVKDNTESVAPKGISIPLLNAESAAEKRLSSNQHKPVSVNSPKVPHPQKKLESLEQLKEELRKKQELLEQKRNDFRRQLDKLEKQATVTEPAVKRHKARIGVDGVKATTPRSSGLGSGVADQATEMIVDKNLAADDLLVLSPETKPPSSKQLIHSSVGDLLSTNRNKLVGGPGTFRILPPLPAGLCNVTALREHFSSYGDLLSVEFENLGSCKDEGEGSEMLKSNGVLVNFATYCSAEKAFINGKLWQGNSLQFTWATPIPSSNDTNDARAICSSDPNFCGDATDVHDGEKSTSKDSQKALATENKENKILESRGIELENEKPCGSSKSIDNESCQDEPSASGELTGKSTYGQQTVSSEKESPGENDR